MGGPEWISFRGSSINEVFCLVPASPWLLWGWSSGTLVRGLSPGDSLSLRLWGAGASWLEGSVGRDLVHGAFEYQVYPFQRVARTGGWFANPVAYPDEAIVFVGTPRDTIRDDVPASPIRGMVAQPQGWQAFPFLVLFAPEVLDLQSPGLGECAPFA